MRKIYLVLFSAILLIFCLAVIFILVFEMNLPSRENLGIISIKKFEKKKRVDDAEEWSVSEVIDLNKYAELNQGLKKIKVPLRVEDVYEKYLKQRGALKNKINFSYILGGFYVGTDEIYLKNKTSIKKFITKKMPSIFIYDENSEEKLSMGVRVIALKGLYECNILLLEEALPKIKNFLSYLSKERYEKIYDYSTRLIESNKEFLERIGLGLFILESHEYFFKERTEYSSPFLIITSETLKELYQGIKVELNATLKITNKALSFIKYMGFYRESIEKNTIVFLKELCINI